eukprot:132981-Pyramimonas_sp.AAC.1
MARARLALLYSSASRPTDAGGGGARKISRRAEEEARNNSTGRGRRGEQQQEDGVIVESTMAGSMPHRSREPRPVEEMTST